MAARQESCSFTGHRPEKLPWGDNERDPRCAALRRRIADALQAAYAEGYRHYLCGMAQGCDLLFGEAVCNLRRRHADVTLEAAIPCPSQADGWPPEQLSRYRDILEQCDAQTMLADRYSPQCMLRRDRYLVDRAALLLAVYDGQPGGTRYTVEYALRRGMEVRYIPLNEEDS